MTVDTSWELENDAETITVDGLVAETIPTVVVGEEITLTFYANDDTNNVSTLYEYAEFINDKSTNYGTTFDGIPWYRFSIYPRATYSTYLFEVRPPDRIAEMYDFWGLVTEVEDVSTLATAGGRFEITFFVLAEADDYTRTEIETEFSADL